jgi:hypothetical protein
VHPRNEESLSTKSGPSPGRAREKFRLFLLCLVTNLPTFTNLGARKSGSRNFCERGIATASRCATIGTVQEIPDENFEHSASRFFTL